MAIGLARLRRAAKRPPRYLAKRLVEMAAHRLRRPWSTIYPAMLTPRMVAHAAGARSVDELWAAQQRAPFFVASERRVPWTAAFRERYPKEAAAIVETANRVLRHEFDLLGSGCVALGPSLPWHTDFKSGREWALEYSPGLHYSELDRPTDIKVPWELSRSQHFTALGQAYWLTGDERYAQEFVAEVTDWTARNPWAYGVNWACAMDIALRAVSWIWAFSFMSDARACASPAFRGAFLRSLYLHGEYIATHIERADVNGNHYLCDAVGLVFLGAFFRSTRKGQRWLADGRQMIAEEILNQTSDDGVDFEKSTPYHRLVLEAFLTTYLLLDMHGEPLPPASAARLERMIEFVEAYTRPDGTIPLIGDADDGRIQKLGTQDVNDHRYLLAAGAVLFVRGDFKRAAGRFADEAFWLLGPDGARAFDGLPLPGAMPASRAFHSGGFYVLRSPRAHVFVDCGEVGMNGRGGHGHNDILGFELWLDGLHVVTDCGAYLYTASREWRNRFRSTEFHNVVQVDDEEMNRFISPDHLWQLQDDARPVDVVWQTGEKVDYFHGGHSGYARLDPPVAVARDIALLKDGPDVLVRDTIEGRGRRTLTWRFHLPPSIAAHRDGSDVRLSSHDREVWLQPSEEFRRLQFEVGDGWMSPSYGVRTPIQVIVWRGEVTLPITTTLRFGLSRLAAHDLRLIASSMPAEQAASAAV